MAIAIAMEVYENDAACNWGLFQVICDWGKVCEFNIADEHTHWLASLGNESHANVWIRDTKKSSPPQRWAFVAMQAAAFPVTGLHVVKWCIACIARRQTTVPENVKWIIGSRTNLNVNSYVM